MVDLTYIKLVKMQMFCISYLASCVSYSIDNCTVTSKNIRHTHAAVPINQIFQVFTF